MPVYGPVFKEHDFHGGTNILASEHFQFIEGAATLDAEKFDKETVKAGTAIARNKDSGKFEPYEDNDDDEASTNFDDFGILNVDFENDGENDKIAGEVIVRGSVYDAKLHGATDAFKKEVPMIRFVKEA